MKFFILFSISKKRTVGSAILEVAQWQHHSWRCSPNLDARIPRLEHSGTVTLRVLDASARQRVGFNIFHPSTFNPEDTLPEGHFNSLLKASDYSN